MRILGLCSYPIEAAATRFRLQQFVEPLAERGIDLTLSPFLNSEQFAGFYKRGSVFRKAAGLSSPIFRRFGESFNAGKYDLALVQREAAFFGPAIFEWLFQKIGKVPMVLDLDDATYVRYVSPSYGQIGSLLKFFGKTDKLIERAEIVICGNRFIAEYVESRSARSVVIPTVVDTEKFYPTEKDNKTPVIGWIGTHSTFAFVEKLFPVLERLAKKHDFVLKIVGAGTNNFEISGIKTENIEWQLDQEISDFQSLDIGLYPVDVSKSASVEWLNGKSGFKAVQYMAVGVPFVMSPVGVCAEMGEPGVTHYNAVTAEDWYNTLDKLLSNEHFRKKMGSAGRNYSLKNFNLDIQSDVLASALRTVTSSRGS